MSERTEVNFERGRSQDAFSTSTLCNYGNRNFYITGTFHWRFARCLRARRTRWPSELHRCVLRFHLSRTV